MAKSVTEKLVDELNATRGLTYPAIGFTLWQDIRGDGRNRRGLYEIINANGGVTRSPYTAQTPRQRVANLRAAIATTKQGV